MMNSDFQETTASHQLDDPHVDIAREELIMIAQLIQQAAPVPRERFKEELKQRLFASAVLAKSNRSMQSRKVAAVLPLVAVLLLTAAAIYAVGTLVQRAVQLDGGLSLETGQALDIAQTMNGYTLTAEWIYADSGRLSIGLSAEAADSTQRTLEGISPETQVHLTDADGLEYPFLTTTGTGTEQNALGVVYSFAVPDHAPVNTASAFRLTVDLQLVGSDLQPFTVGRFLFDIRAVITPIARPFNLPQTTTASGIAVTLASLQVTPSLTRIETCFTVQDPEFSDWFPNVHLRVGNRNLNDGTIRIDGGSSTSSDCRYTNFYVDLVDEEGTWQIEITELIGTRMLTFDQPPIQPIPSDSFERRITGPWQFTLEGE
jgi:hypothetical protein